MDAFKQVFAMLTPTGWAIVIVAVVAVLALIVYFKWLEDFGGEE